MNDEQTNTETQQQQQEAFAREIALMGKAIGQRGVERYGREQWDQMVGDVATAVASKTGCSQNEAQLRLAATLAPFDDPIELIRAMSEDQDRRDRILQMGPAQQLVELARLEAQSSPHGRRVGGTTPAWRTTETGGRVSDDDWRRTGGAALTDDNAWSREWDRRAHERFGIGSGRFRAGGRP